LIIDCLILFIYSFFRSLNKEQSVAPFLESWIGQAVQKWLWRKVIEFFLSGKIGIISAIIDTV